MLSRIFGASARKRRLSTEPALRIKILTSHRKLQQTQEMSTAVKWAWIKKVALNILQHVSSSLAYWLNVSPWGIWAPFCSQQRKFYACRMRVICLHHGRRQEYSAIKSKQPLMNFKLGNIYQLPIYGIILSYCARVCSISYQLTKYHFRISLICMVL
jgi:hypothetical protein